MAKHRSDPQHGTRSDRVGAPGGAGSTRHEEAADRELLEFERAAAHQAIIKVIGVGGGGGNAVNNMVVSGLRGVEFIAANTDAQALRHNLAPTKLQLGSETKLLPAPIDGVFLWADAAKVVITQRARFSYVFSPETVRRIKVCSRSFR